MTNTSADALARIDRALARIEAVATRSATPDARYARLKARTQDALAQLDTVIARVASEENR